MKNLDRFAVVLIIGSLSMIANAQQIPPVNSTLADSTLADSTLADNALADNALADNAALVYWQAFASLPELDDVTAKALDNVLRGEKASAEVLKVLSYAQESLRQLRRAEKCSQCEWGLEYERGIEMSLPHLSQARKLSKLACARARVRFDAGERQAAFADVIATLTMARRVGENAAVISLLVDYAIEQQAIDVLVKYLPQLEADELKVLEQQITDLPASKTMADGWRMEKELLLGWFVRELQKPDSKDRVLGMFPNQDDANVVALKKLSQSEILDAALKLRSVYDKVIEAMALSPGEVDAFVEKLTAEAPSMGTERHFAALIIPPAQSLRRSEAVYQARWALLVAAIAVASDGQEALDRDRLQDPFGDGPFEYSAVAGGFELTSKLIGRDGKPVKLLVGGQ